MGIFSCIETFFFCSLAISFILILLLVYHFKQRVVTMEQKNDTVVSIINDIAKELASVKAMVGPRGASGPMASPFTAFMCNMPNMSAPFPNTGEATFQEIHEIHGAREALNAEDDEEEDDDEDEDDEDDDDEDDEDDDDDEEDDDKIVVSDTEEGGLDINDIDEVNVADIQQSVQEIISRQDDPVMTEEEKDNYRKMNVQELKQVIVAKNLPAEQTRHLSKLKRNELLQLLGVSSV